MSGGTLLSVTTDTFTNPGQVAILATAFVTLGEASDGN